METPVKRHDALDNLANSLAVIVFFTYFFAPAETLLVGVPVRLRDIALFVASPLIVLYAITQAKNIHIKGSFLAYVSFALYSVGLSIFSDDVMSYLTAIRLMTYVLFYFIGIQLSRVLQNDSVWAIFLLCSILHMLIDPYGGNPTWESVKRITISFGGPYNVGLVFAMLIFVVNDPRLKLACLVLVLASGSRTLILGLFLYATYNGISLSLKQKRLYPLILLTLTVALLLATSASDRMIKGLSKLDATVALAIDNSQHRNAAKSQEEYLALFHSRTYAIATEMGSDGETIDVSLYMRFTTWIDILKTNIASTTKFIFGSGPNFFFTAADGSLIKLLGEYGILGTILYCIFLGLCFLELGQKAIVGMFILSGLLIDTYFSSIGVPFLIMLMGANTLKNVGLSHNKNFS